MKIIQNGKSKEELFLISEEETLHELEFLHGVLIKSGADPYGIFIDEGIGFFRSNFNEKTFNELIK